MLQVLRVLAAGMSSKAVTCELNLHFNNISCLQCHFVLVLYMRPTSQTADVRLGLHKQRISAQIVRKHLSVAYIQTGLYCMP